MTELTVVFVGVSLLLYVLLGGADFGAGIIEIFTGKKASDTISKAIAPVWEANHIWLIVVIVILFNAFPEVYSTLTMYLHIPLMLVLIGIIFRGTAFSFRYYDPFEDKTHRIYTMVFRIFSIFTPFFLGVTLGAVILGRLTPDTSLGYYEQYVAPWLSLFSLSLGTFLVVLFAFLASVFLAGEPGDAENRNRFRKYAIRLLALLIVLGGGVFISAEISGLSLFSMYLDSWISMASVVVATVLVPFLLISLKREKTNRIRLIAGAQTTGILIGWFGVQFPHMIEFRNSEPLTVYNAIAPDATVRMLIIALLVGLAIIIPLMIYLLKVFKFDSETSY